MVGYNKRNKYNDNTRILFGTRPNNIRAIVSTLTLTLTAEVSRAQDVGKEAYQRQLPYVAGDSCVGKRRGDDLVREVQTHYHKEKNYLRKQNKIHRFFHGNLPFSSAVILQIEFYTLMKRIKYYL